MDRSVSSSYRSRSLCRKKTCPSFTSSMDTYREMGISTCKRPHPTESEARPVLCVRTFSQDPLSREAKALNGKLRSAHGRGFLWKIKGQCLMLPLTFLGDMPSSGRGVGMRQALAIGYLMQSGKQVRSGRASVWSPLMPPGSRCHGGWPPTFTGVQTHC